ncbi:MAG: hypothetical protein JSU65_14195 [Candidatus Zixiibacteriota bacterium]|nr:MAG: hypothetical protein JSU65_14195 [candidate division Zixibacteria bacterium]
MACYTADRLSRIDRDRHRTDCSHQVNWVESIFTNLIAFHFVDAFWTRFSEVHPTADIRFTLELGNELGTVYMVYVLAVDSGVPFIAKWSAGPAPFLPDSERVHGWEVELSYDYLTPLEFDRFFPPPDHPLDPMRLESVYLPLGASHSYAGFVEIRDGNEKNLTIVFNVIPLGLEHQTTLLGFLERLFGGLREEDGQLQWVGPSDWTEFMKPDTGDTSGTLDMPKQGGWETLYEDSTFFDFVPFGAISQTGRLAARKVPAGVVPHPVYENDMDSVYAWEILEVNDLLSADWHVRDTIPDYYVERIQFLGDTAIAYATDNRDLSWCLITRVLDIASEPCTLLACAYTGSHCPGTSFALNLADSLVALTSVGPSVIDGLFRFRDRQLIDTLLVIELAGDWSFSHDGAQFLATIPAWDYFVEPISFSTDLILLDISSRRVDTLISINTAGNGLYSQGRGKPVYFSTHSFAVGYEYVWALDRETGLVAEVARFGEPIILIDFHLLGDSVVCLILDKSRETAERYRYLSYHAEY